MSRPLRALLWAAVLVAPGGLAVLPLLVADAAKRYRKERRDRAPAAEVASGELPVRVGPEAPTREAA